MWKLLTGVIADQIYAHLVKSRNKNLAMAWMDYTKPYDMVPHSWIIECLDLMDKQRILKLC